MRRRSKGEGFLIPLSIHIWRIVEYAARGIKPLSATENLDE